MRVVYTNKGEFGLFNDDGTPFVAENLQTVDIHISTEGVIAQLGFPVTELAVDVPDTGVTKIKRGT